MIRYTVNGVVHERADQGETAARVLKLLAPQPWQTTKDLSTHHRTMKRLVKSGKVVRRLGERRVSSGPGRRPVEHALASELERKS
jgi:hypothetical protein